MKKTVFLYARVSTDKQDTERQINDLNAFAESNNLQIVGRHTETISGTKSVKARQQMLKEVENAKPDYFVITDISRFGRNVKVALTLKDELHKLGVCLWSIETGLKSLNPDGTPNPIANLVFTQLLSVYEMENAQKRQAIKSGLRTARMKGKRLGRPEGSTIDLIKKYSKAVKLIQEEEEKKLNKQRYLSVRKTAAYLNTPTSTIISLRKEMKERGLMPILLVPPSPPYEANV